MSAESPLHTHDFARVVYVLDGGEMELETEVKHAPR